MYQHIDYDRRRSLVGQQFLKLQAQENQVIPEQD
jgi:hypothetical protein